MPSTVYRGDLTEITFGHESGITIEDSAFGSVRFVAKSGTRDKIKDTSVIKFTGGAAGAPIDDNQKIAFPRGMLVGSQLVFSGLDGSHDDRSGRQRGELQAVCFDIPPRHPNLGQGPSAA